MRSGAGTGSRRRFILRPTSAARTGSGVAGTVSRIQMRDLLQWCRPMHQPIHCRRSLLHMGLSRNPAGRTGDQLSWGQAYELPGDAMFPPTPPNE